MFLCTLIKSLKYYRHLAHSTRKYLKTVRIYKIVCELQDWVDKICKNVEQWFSEAFTRLHKKTAGFIVWFLTINHRFYHLWKIF